MADIIDFNDLLNADISKAKIAGNKIATLDPKKLEKSVDINIEGASFTESTAIDDLLAASSKTDSSDVPQTSSYQPQNEASLAVSGTFTQKSAIGSTVNNALSIQDKSLEFLQNSIKLSPDYQQLNFADSLIKDSNKILSTGTLSLAASSEKANGGIIFNSATDFKVAGNNVFFGSEGTIHETTPIKSTVTDTTISQAKAHHTTADVKTENLKNKVQHIEQAKVTTAANVHKVATQTDRSYVKDGSYTATEGYTTAGKNLTNYADKKAQTSSADIVYVTAQGNSIQQAGSISITASAGTITQGNPTKADGLVVDTTTGEISQGSSGGGKVDRDTLGNSRSNSSGTKETSSTGSVNILAHDPTGNGGALTMISQQSLSSVVKDTVSFAGGKDIKMAQEVVSSAITSLMASSKSSSIYGAAQASIGTASGVVSMVGRRTWIGRRFSLPKITEFAAGMIPIVASVPPLPVMPGGITTQSLDSCLPKKKDDDTNDIGESDGDRIKRRIEERKNLKEKLKASPSKEDLIRRLKASPIPTTKTQTTIPTDIKGVTNNTSNIKTSEIVSNAEGDGYITNISIEETGVVNGEGIRLTPASGTATNTSPINQNQPIDSPNYTISANGVNRGGLDIFYAETNTNSPEAYSTPEDTSNAGDNSVESKCISVEDANVALTKEIIEEVSNELQLTPDLLLSHYDDKVIFFKLKLEDLKNLTVDNLDKTISNSGLEDKDKQKAKKIFSDILKQPSGIKLVTTLVERIYSTLGVGGLFSSIQKAYSSYQQVSNTVNIVSNISKQSNPLKIYEEVSKLPGISKYTSGISSLVNSSSTLSTLASLGQQIIKGNDTQVQEEITNIITKTIDKELNKQLSKIIGLSPSNIQEIIEQVKEIEVGKGFSIEQRNNLINRIGTIVGGDKYVEGEKIYKSVSGIIEQINKGDINSLLAGEGINNILGYIIGPSNVGILNEVKDIYTKGKDIYETLKVVPSLIKMMNDYEIPLLNQINTALSCLDLMNKATDLIESLTDLFDSNDKSKSKDKSKTEGRQEEIDNPHSPILNKDEESKEGSKEKEEAEEDKKKEKQLECEESEEEINIESDECTKRERTIEIIENLPRLIQIYNSIKETPTIVLEPTYKDEIEITPITKEEIEEIKKAEIEIPISACYTIPELNYLEAKVGIVQVSNNKVLFQVSNKVLLDYNEKEIKPGIGKVVQLNITEFVNAKTGEKLTISRDCKFYTPAVYSFEILDYKEEGNIGLASIIPLVSRIYLENGQGVVYEYDVSDIGRRLIPTIKDSYLLL